MERYRRSSWVETVQHRCSIELLVVFTASVGSTSERFRFYDRAKHTAAAERYVFGACLHFENEEAPFISRQASCGVDERPGEDSFQVIDFDARAHGDRAFRQRGLNSLRSGDFHHADHRGSGEDGRKPVIKCGESPFGRDDFFDGGFEPEREPFLWRGIAGGTQRAVARRRSAEARAAAENRRGSTKWRLNSVRVIPSCAQRRRFMVR